MYRCLAAAFLVALAACDTPPIAWTDPVIIGSPVAPARLIFDSAGQSRLIRDTMPAVNPPAARGLCRSSVRIARGSVHLYAAWWAVRPDSSAILYAAPSSDSGKTW